MEPVGLSNKVSSNKSTPNYALTLRILPALAQTREKGPWWPNLQWGPNDQSGGSNWITPEKIVKAVALVKTGKVYELGHIYERGMPMVGKWSNAR